MAVATTPYVFDLLRYAGSAGVCWHEVAASAAVGP
jgi:hypothetical protein